MQVFSAGEGDARVRETTLTTDSNGEIILRNSRGSGEKLGLDSEVLVLEAILTNKLHASDECYKEKIRHNDNSPMADQCHGVIFIITPRGCGEEPSPKPGSHTEESFWSGFQPLLKQLGTCCVGIVKNILNGRCFDDDCAIG